ncbi:5'-nucleotidase, lipoprotein e(P4) family [candidate division CSSED10-310 bacterium]|uniref:5'-nucleotidase, lipoprotein e(P4) family n=1 Tax=candidate division CSSED10-310 bacterium TaxID=2855610 RepID=A0ABV6YXJ1_UNCC1
MTKKTAFFLHVIMGLLVFLFIGTRPGFSDTAATMEKEQSSEESTSYEQYKLLHTILWLQSAAENKATALQAFNQARKMLDQALDDKTWTAATEQTENFADLPPAIVLDIDETILDNSPYQARLIMKNIEYDKVMWRQWAAESNARPLPGAVEFVQYAHKRGVTVFYVTNRDYKLETVTRRNLEKFSFPIDDSRDTVFCKYEKKWWTSDKKSRRKAIAAEFRILLLLGDNFNDFVSGTKVTPEARLVLMEKYQSYWGNQWIIIPNPLYGGWVSSLTNFDYKLSDAEKLDIFLKTLIKD